MGQQKIGASNSDSMTTYLADPSPIQGIRPQPWQRGVQLDGSSALPPLLPSAANGAANNCAGGSCGDGNPVSDDNISGNNNTPGSAYWGNKCFLQNIEKPEGWDAKRDHDIAFPAVVQWIIGHTYNGVQLDDQGDPMDSNGFQGVNWMQVSQPELAWVDGGPLGLSTGDYIYAVVGAGTFLEFKHSANTTFLGANGTSGAVVIDTTTYDNDIAIVYLPSGLRMEYFWYNDANTDDDVEGQLWRIVDPSGAVAYVGHPTDSSDAISNGYNITTGAIILAYDSADRRFTYSYDGDQIGGVYHLEQVKAEVDNGGWTEIARVDYSYYIDADSFGDDGDLKEVRITTQGMDDGGDQTIVKYYRYYEGSFDAESNPGHPHQILMSLDYEGVRKYDWDQDSAFDDDHLAASTSDLRKYASAYFEYDAEHRVVSTWENGACGCTGGSGNGEYLIEYELNPDFDDNDDPDAYDEDLWFIRTIVAQPDGTYVTQYYDEAGQTLSRVVTDDDPDNMTPPSYWATYIDRDEDGYVVAVHTPENVTAYTHSTGSFTLDTGVTLGTGGLIVVYDRISSGNLKGYVRHIKHKRGTSGTEYLDQTVFYDDTTAKLDIPPLTGEPYVTFVVVDEVWTYDEETSDEAEEDDVAPPSGARQTEWTYTFHSSGSEATKVLRPKQITTTFPAVSEGNNGSASATTMSRYQRLDGDLPPVFVPVSMLVQGGCAMPVEACAA